MNILFKLKNFSFSFVVSGWRNTAYSQFSIEQLNQTDKYRWARIKANERFDYDSPGMLKDKHLDNILLI
jgi:hypothetical protein